MRLTILSDSILGVGFISMRNFYGSFIFIDNTNEKVISKMSVFYSGFWRSLFLTSLSHVVNLFYFCIYVVISFKVEVNLYTFPSVESVIMWRMLV